MSTVALVIQFLNASKQYAPVIAAVASGVGMILSKNYSGGINTIFQALTLVFSGATVVSLQNAVAKSSPK
ncbi:hypothetical protein [Paludisphaera borealis]|uniref:Uncharacterized protein n=1 Tax=Paludisphaera borealis TaxID=1387353 RepID=A0A1U7CJX6_9BACT|nr:hypothetical protein [Paludisphaera borealis]APW59235.1 hypothetical protein BSF38_00651 [Paludisphaera borealis]MDR3622788.1 hypothetical protein [Paludisphaera borealis]